MSQLDATMERSNTLLWERDGFFIVRDLVPKSQVDAIEHEVISCIRSDPPERHAKRVAYQSGEDYFIAVETAPSPSAVNPEDKISKVFNCHTQGETLRVAQSDAIVDRVADLLGPDLDCFQSQFIFKNPGVVGQPWHQDSLYFDFTLQPQVGVWLALSKATLENGCLWVLPGSHHEPIHRHVPDRRPEANRGYLEIVDHEFGARIPVTMEPGDVLFFHSFLMHMSTDNVTDYRRSAMVYHYGRAGTQVSPRVPPERVAALNNVNRWVRSDAASLPDVSSSARRLSRLSPPIGQRSDLSSAYEGWIRERPAYCQNTSVISTQTSRSLARGTRKISSRPLRNLCDLDVKICYSGDAAGLGDADAESSRPCGLCAGRYLV